MHESIFWHCTHFCTTMPKLSVASGVVPINLFLQIGVPDHEIPRTIRVLEFPHFAALVDADVERVFQKYTPRSNAKRLFVSATTDLTPRESTCNNAMWRALSIIVANDKCTWNDWNTTLNIPDADCIASVREIKDALGYDIGPEVLFMISQRVLVRKTYHFIKRIRNHIYECAKTRAHTIIVRALNLRFDEKLWRMWRAFDKKQASAYIRCTKQHDIISFVNDSVTVTHTRRQIVRCFSRKRILAIVSGHELPDDTFAFFCFNIAGLPIARPPREMRRIANLETTDKGRTKRLQEFAKELTTHAFNSNASDYIKVLDDLMCSISVLDVGIANSVIGLLGDHGGKSVGSSAVFRKHPQLLTFGLPGLRARLEAWDAYIDGVPSASQLETIPEEFRSANATRRQLRARVTEWLRENIIYSDVPTDTTVYSIAKCPLLCDTIVDVCHELKSHSIPFMHLIDDTASAWDTEPAISLTLIRIRNRKQ